VGDEELLAELRYHWGDAYEISHPERDVWVAQRNDTRETVRAATGDGLFGAIGADYRARPVPRPPVPQDSVVRRYGG
jgi:hypothetical protein